MKHLELASDRKVLTAIDIVKTQTLENSPAKAGARNYWVKGETEARHF